MMTSRVLRTICGLCLLGLLCVRPAGSQEEPATPTAPVSYIRDDASLLTPKDRQIILSYASELEEKTAAQLAVATVQSTQPETLEAYAVRLFETWGIGEKGKDNGVLLLVALEDRKVRIEVGYGLEGVITDATADQIIRHIIIPYFKQNRFSEGIRKASTALVSLIARSYGVSITGKEDAVQRAVDGGGTQDNRDLMVAVLAFLFIGLLVLPRRKGKGSQRGSSPYYWYGSGYGGSHGGFGGGFGSGRGFGGFGGGLSGGGGASGSW